MSGQPSLRTEPFVSTLVCFVPHKGHCGKPGPLFSRKQWLPRLACYSLNQLAPQSTDMAEARTERLKMEVYEITLTAVALGVVAADALIRLHVAPARRDRLLKQLLGAVHGAEDGASREDEQRLIPSLQREVSPEQRL